MKKHCFVLAFAVAMSLALTAFAQNYASVSGAPVSRMSWLRNQGYDGAQNMLGDPALLLYFPMADCGAGPFIDISGHGFSAVPIGVYQGNAKGKIGRCAPYFNKGNPISYSVSPTPTITVPFSVSVWVQPQSPGTTAFPRVVESVYTSGFFIGGDNTGKWVFAVKNTFVTAAGTITTGGWPNTPWTMLTGTYDGTNMNFYINGSLARGPTAATSPGTQTITLAIGGCSASGSAGCAGTGNGWWDGQIQGVRIYTRTLGATEIAAIYAAENH